MAFILGSTTLPNPKSVKRSYIETEKTNLTINNKTTRRIVNRKERFEFVFRNLTPAQLNSILSEYELQMPRSLEITETNLPIGPTDVLIDLVSRDYPKTGKQYRINTKIILTEVK